jgi:Type III secretion system, cytoplasmic E component of needle
MFERELEVEQLETRLADDPRGVALKELVDRLAAGKGRALGELNRGVTAEKHERLALLLKAFDAGIDALPRLWERLNSRG